MSKTKGILAGFAVGVIGAVFSALLLAADPFPPSSFQPLLNSPASSLVPVTASDSAELANYGRAIWVGGAGNIVIIGSNDGATTNGASLANAATLTLNTTSQGQIPSYSSATPGQYIIVNDGTHAAEIISGYLDSTKTTLTVTTGGGAGGTTCANAHNSGTLVAAYAPLIGVNAGTMISVRAKRVMSTNTTATSIVEVY